MRPRLWALGRRATHRRRRNGRFAVWPSGDRAAAAAGRWPRATRHRRAGVLLHDGHSAAAPIRPLAGEHFVEHDPQAVEVGAHVDPLTLCLFWADVIGRTEHLADAGIPDLI